MSCRAVAACPICLDCSEDETWVALECGHVMHTTCAAQSVEHAKKCPVCRVRGGEWRSMGALVCVRRTMPQVHACTVVVNHGGARWTMHAHKVHA